MSKKPKCSRHRVPTLTMVSDPVTPEYQAEVDRSMARLERRHVKAQKALEAAEKRAAKAAVAAQNIRDHKAQVRHRDLLAVVEERRRELHQIELLMMPSNYSGRDGHRRHARHESGAITIPLGATTGQRQPSQPLPTFPVETRRKA